MEQGVLVDFFWTLGLAIASHIGRDCVEASFC
jgi:hypothetical protein